MKMASSLLSILSRVANKMGYQELRAKQQEAILGLVVINLCVSRVCHVIPSASSERKKLDGFEIRSLISYMVLRAGLEPATYGYITDLATGC